MKNFLIYFGFLLTLSSCLQDSGGSGDGTGDFDRIDSNSHRVFITSATYDGSTIGGISGANAKCASLATAAKLELKYVAVLSSSGSNIIDNLVFTGAVYTVDASGTPQKVVSLGSDLWTTDSTSGKDLENTIIYDENGDNVSATPWTGTNSDGTAENDCTKWTTNSPNTSGMIGSNISASATWLEFDPSEACDIEHPIYCISQ